MANAFSLFLCHCDHLSLSLKLPILEDFYYYLCKIDDLGNNLGGEGEEEISLMRCGYFMVIVPRNFFFSLCFSLLCVCVLS